MHPGGPDARCEEEAPLAGGALRDWILKLNEVCDQVMSCAKSPERCSVPNCLLILALLFYAERLIQVMGV